MDACPLVRRVYIVEGDVNKQDLLPQVQSLITAVWETRLSGYWVEETQNYLGTAQFLINLHRSLEISCRLHPSTECTYEQFKAGCREFTTHTVSQVYMHMLRQIPGLSASIAEEIQLHYPTLAHLMDAYLQPDRKRANADDEWKRRSMLLSEIKVGVKNVGPALSTRIARVFTMPQYSSFCEHDDEPDMEEYDDGVE